MYWTRCIPGICISGIERIPSQLQFVRTAQTGVCCFLCINKTASEENQSAAEDFLYWLFTSETGKRYVSEELGFITPFNTFSEEETPDDPLAKEVVSWMNKEGVDTVPWDFTIFPSQIFKNNFGSNLLQYAQGTKKWATVKDETDKDWKSESGR